MLKIHSVVKGYVQGVGYRYYACRMAERLGISGWVRNLPGGDVELEAYGNPETLDEFLRLLYRGPSSSEVSEIQTEKTTVEQSEYGSFDVKY